MTDDTPTPAPAAAPAAPQRHASVTTAFVLSLLSLILFPPLAIISFVMARRARRDVAAHPGQYITDDGMLKAAWVMSIIGLVFVVFFLIYLVFFIYLVLGSDVSVITQDVGTQITPVAP